MMQIYAYYFNLIVEFIIYDRMKSLSLYSLQMYMFELEILLPAEMTHCSYERHYNEN